MKRYRSTATHNNMHGYRGVEWHQSKGKFAARIEPATGQRGRWLGRYDTPAQAALAYDAAARAVYGDEAYLNFPKGGEKKTEPSRIQEGLCPKGHDLTKYSYRSPDGSRSYCRKCNAEASARWYAKKRRAPAPSAGEEKP